MVSGPVGVVVAGGVVTAVVLTRSRARAAIAGDNGTVIEALHVATPCSPGEAWLVTAPIEVGPHVMSPQLHQRAFSGPRAPRDDPGRGAWLSCVRLLAAHGCKTRSPHA